MLELFNSKYMYGGKNKEVAGESSTFALATESEEEETYDIYDLFWTWINSGFFVKNTIKTWF